jgi:hypothetical protein
MLKKGRPAASLVSIGQDRTATIGEQLIVSCISFGATSAPNLTIHANGQNIKDMYGGNINNENVQVNGNSIHRQGLALVGYIDTVTNGLFDHANNLLIECKAWYGDQMFKKKELSLQKRDIGRQAPGRLGQQVGRPGHGGGNNQQGHNQHSQQGRQGRGKHF